MKNDWDKKNNFINYFKFKQFHKLNNKWDLQKFKNFKLLISKSLILFNFKKYKFQIEVKYIFLFIILNNIKNIANNKFTAIIGLSLND